MIQISGSNFHTSLSSCCSSTTEKSADWYFYSAPSLPSESGNKSNKPPPPSAVYSMVGFFPSTTAEVGICINERGVADFLRNSTDQALDLDSGSQAGMATAQLNCTHSSALWKQNLICAYTALKSFSQQTSEVPALTGKLCGPALTT